MCGKRERESTDLISSGVQQKGAQRTECNKLNPTYKVACKNCVERKRMLRARRGKNKHMCGEIAMFRRVSTGLPATQKNCDGRPLRIRTVRCQSVRLVGHIGANALVRSQRTHHPLFPPSHTHTRTISNQLSRMHTCARKRARSRVALLWRTRSRARRRARINIHTHTHGCCQQPTSRSHVVAHFVFRIALTHFTHPHITTKMVTALSVSQSASPF